MLFQDISRLDYEKRWSWWCKAKLNTNMRKQFLCNCSLISLINCENCSRHCNSL